MKTQAEPSAVLKTGAQSRARRAQAGAAPSPKSGWRAVAGMLESDDLSREAARLGARWRARENKRR